MNINEVLDTCLSNMKASVDFNDYATVSSIKDLLECIIDNPAILVNYTNEEKLSIALSSILTCRFPVDFPSYNGFDVRNLVFASSFYLFMHQLERRMFYDRNWPAFITLIHYGRKEFAKFIIDTNPFAPERLEETIDYRRSLNAAKGFELNMMLAAKKKKVWMEEITDWYDELCDDDEDLLAYDSFRNEALPLYRTIANYLKENDLSFVNI